MRVIIGVTGGQGVGKSTFCRNLFETLSSAHIPVTLLDELGSAAVKANLPFGSSSNSDTIARIYGEHLRRQRSMSPSLCILDRCLIDALAYARVLRQNTEHELFLYKEITLLGMAEFDLVVHLTMTGPFVNTTATHENAADRAAVATQISMILDEVGVETLVGQASASFAQTVSGRITNMLCA